MNKIISCRGTQYQHLSISKKELENIIVDAEVIDFKKDYCPIKYPNIKSDGPYSFVISDISSTDKISRAYCNCSGLIATGIDAITGNDISFITHQEPTNILGSHMLSFRLSLESTLRTLVSRSVTGSIDIVYFGGEIKNEPEQYQKMTRYINNIVYDVCELEPVVISHPKNGDYKQDSIVYNTNTRRLFISCR